MRPLVLGAARRRRTLAGESRPRGGARWRGAWLNLLLFGAASVVVGCGGSDDPPSEDGEGETGEPPSPPSIELAALELDAAALDDVVAAVADLRPDTRVDIDGHAWLPGGVAPAALEGESLRIWLGGALVVGHHELSLVHTIGSDELRSELVDIEIVESEPGPLSASLNPAVVGSGDGLVAHGQGADAIFALVDTGAATAGIRAGQWSADGFELELPGVAAGKDARLDVAVADTTDARWVVAAWIDADARSVHARVAPVDGLGVAQGEPGDALELWSLDDPEQLAAIGPHELARIDAVAVLGRTVVIAVEARRDAERASPGDHLLVTRWLIDVDEAAAPILMRGPAASDLDLPADARLWTGIGHGEALSVRRGLGFAWLLRVQSNGLPALDGDPGELAALPVATTWMLSADGAFGSRHVFSINAGAPTPSMRMLRLNRWSEAADDPSTLVDELELPAWPSGEPRLNILDGVPTLVIPMGPELDVLGLRSTGAAAVLDPIPELRCDALALAGPSFDGVGDTLPLACLLGGELRIGALGVD